LPETSKIQWGYHTFGAIAPFQHLQSIHSPQMSQPPMLCLSAAGEFITRKEDSDFHGIGIKSVKKTVEKYHGIIEFTSEGAEFSVDIMLYL
jgi:hypothetical protein